MSLKKIWILILFPVALQAQDLDFVRKMIDTLCSASFQGRGYTNNSDFKTASLIKEVFQQEGLDAPGDRYLMPFSINVNTFPGAMELKTDSISFQAGVDFIPTPCSPSIKGTYKAVLRPIEKDHVLIIPKGENPLSNAYTKAIVYRTAEKLTWHISQDTCDLPSFTLKDTSATINQLYLNMNSKWLSNYTTNNIIGIRKGRVVPDSMVMITAHYDHIGQMGNSIYIPGANDNASGTAMLLNIAKDYREPYYTTVFVAFSGEELGLLGSFHFVRNSPIDLKKVKFVLNLDLVGTGEDGMTVVNGSVYSEAFQLLTNLNNSHHYMPEIKIRGEACNSDHCPFHLAGVPSFFMYTRGGIKAYHDIYDRAETLPLTGYKGLYRLLVDFMENLNQIR